MIVIILISEEADIFYYESVSAAILAAGDLTLAPLADVAPRVPAYLASTAKIASLPQLIIISIN